MEVWLYRCSSCHTRKQVTTRCTDKKNWQKMKPNKSTFFTKCPWTRIQKSLWISAMSSSVVLGFDLFAMTIRCIHNASHIEVAKDDTTLHYSGTQFTENSPWGLTTVALAAAIRIFCQILLSNTDDCVLPPSTMVPGFQSHLLFF